MPEFSYRAVDARGQTVTGTLSGDSALSVRVSLKNEGLLPVRIKGREGLFTSATFSLKLKRELDGKALSQFCRHLSVITASGVNILKGLESIAEKTSDKGMRSEAGRIHREVQKGRSIAEAMGDSGSLMPGLLTSMVATGEASGNLDVVLRSMAEFYEKDSRVKQKIKSASIYPIVMLIMAAGLIAFFFNFLLPQLVTLITSSGGELPLLTRIVIGISDFTTRYFVLIIVFLAGLALLLKLYFKTPGGRLRRDGLLLKLPLLGNTLRNVATMRFARTAHLLIKSGLPLPQGLGFIKQNVNNALAEKAVDHALVGLQRGESLAANLAKAKYFDALAIQMISVGEETGELEKVLDEMAGFYGQESDAGFTRLLALVEPVMLLIIGGIVSTVIISVMLPMLDMISHIKR